MALKIRSKIEDGTIGYNVDVLSKKIFINIFYLLQLMNILEDFKSSTALENKCYV